jgi:hypothetical protein
MSGNGVAGIIAGGLRCITKGSLPNGMSKYFGGVLRQRLSQISRRCGGGGGGGAARSDMQTSSMIYFALSGFILFLCIVGYFVLLRLPITKYYMAQSQVRLVRRFRSLWQLHFLF